MNYHGPYIAYFISIPLLLVPMLILMLIPNTNPQKQTLEDTTHSNAASENVIETEGARSIRLQTMQKLRNLLSHFKRDLLPLLRSTTILRGMFGILLVTFALLLGEVLMQYMHVRFHWSYEEVGYCLVLGGHICHEAKWCKATFILSFDAASKIIVLCTFLPLLHTILIKAFDSPDEANLVLGKVSVVFHGVGTFIMGISNTPTGLFAGSFPCSSSTMHYVNPWALGIAISALGTGFGAAIRAFLTSLVPKHETAVLYTLISVFGALGALTGGPFLQYLLSIGIRVGGWIMGLPFFFASGLYIICGIGIWTLRVPRPMTPEEN